jgi:hypothetical protein
MMPKFRYSLNNGVSWVIVDSDLPYTITSSVTDDVMVEPIGAAVINSFGQPNLLNLGLSVNAGTVGSALTINILNTRPGSTLSGSMPSGLTLNSSARTITGTPEAAGSFSLSLIETLADSANSPRVTSNLAFTVQPAAQDVTAPVLSSPADVSSGSSSMTGSANTNEGNGTLFWFVSTSASPPSLSALKAGTNAAAYGSQAVSSTGTQNISGSGLISDTNYFTHFVQTDAAGNNSAIVSADGFTTDSANPIVSTGLLYTFSTDYTGAA